jgi:hypothetical protein
MDIQSQYREAFKPLPAKSQRKPATKAGVMVLLDLLVSDRYLKGKLEVSKNEHFATAYHYGWIKLDGKQWSSGMPFERHAITGSGHEIRAMLHDELIFTVDEYSAEWVAAGGLIPAPVVPALPTLGLSHVVPVQEMVSAKAVTDLIDTALAAGLDDDGTLLTRFEQMVKVLEDFRVTVSGEIPF